VERAGGAACLSGRQDCEGNKDRKGGLAHDPIRAPQIRVKVLERSIVRNQNAT